MKETLIPPHNTWHVHPIGNWSKFETIFIAALFINIFSVTSPVSKYLQTKLINYLQAWAMIDTLKNRSKIKEKMLTYYFYLNNVNSLQKMLTLILLQTS